MREAIALFAIKTPNETRIWNTGIGQYPVRFTSFNVSTFETTPLEYNVEIRRIADYVKKTYGCERKVIEAYGKTFVLFHTANMKRKDIEIIAYAAALQLGIA
jgi:hypothetical protein